MLQPSIAASVSVEGMGNGDRTVNSGQWSVKELET